MQAQPRWNLWPQMMSGSIQGSWIRLKRKLCHVFQQPSNDRLVCYTRFYQVPGTNTTFKKEKHNLMAFLWHLSLKNKIKTKKRSSQLCSKCSCQLRKVGVQKFTEKWGEISLVGDRLTSRQATNRRAKPSQSWNLKHVALNKKVI